MLGIKHAALPASLRRTNQRTVISLLLRMGCASRADLAKAAGISQPTAGKITTQLLERGLLREMPASTSEPGPNGEGLGSPKLGRPGTLLQLDPERMRFLAIELGVLWTRVAALPVAIRPTEAWTCAFRTPASPAAWVEGLKEAANQLPTTGLWGVLLSVPGIVDETSDRVIFSPNLHWLEGALLGDLIGQVWNLPVVLMQEIRALALGHLATEPVREDFFLADFGTGVGGAVVMDGMLYRHPTPLNGEFGHTLVRGNDRACGCGARGCLETLISRRGLLESFAAARGRVGKPAPGAADARTPAPLPSDPVDGWGETSEWKGLLDHVAEHGVEPWLADTLDTAARVIAGGLNVLGLHRVVVTGSLTEFPAVVFEHLSESIRRGALWARFGEVTCQAAPRRRSAGLVAMGIDRLVLPAGESLTGPNSRRPFPAPLTS